MKTYTLIAMTLMTLVAGCHKPSETSIHNRPATASPPPHIIIHPNPVTPPPTIHHHYEHHPRWLMTERYNVDTKKTWVKASFEADRNKIIINIRNIRQFAIDTRHIQIDWNRRVILSINHRNSELKKRDYPVLRFELDQYNQWYVVEPK